jgi:small GTP-binding protein
MVTRTCSLCIVGDGSVGKSTIINCFKTQGFVPVYKQTVGCDFYEKQVSIRSTLISLRVWDIGGQSLSSPNLKSYISHADALMLVYDVTNSQSFANMEDWLLQIQRHAPHAVIYVVGNKVDLIARRQISEKQHDQFLEMHENIRKGMFLSGKTGENIVKMFYKIAGELNSVALTENELACYDQVLVAHIEKSNDEKEVRNSWADEIEKEDMEAEQRKRKRETGLFCLCS